MIFLFLIAFTFTTIIDKGQPMQQPKDFINIDCGIEEGHTYVDNATQLLYTSDHDFTESGEIVNFYENNFPSRSVTPFQLLSCRTFPEGERNCYSIRVKQGVKYLIRARFMYGNNAPSDDLPIKFELHLGPLFWEKVIINDQYAVYNSELMMVAGANPLSICLVNIDSGTPFISALEIRPILSTHYPFVDVSNTYTLDRRSNAGVALNEPPIRYPVDPYDRLWHPLSYNATYLEQIITNSVIGHLTNDLFNVPSEILQTALVTVRNFIDFPKLIAMKEKDDSIAKYRFIFHFSEVQVSESSRTFVVLINGKSWSKPFKVPYGIAGSIYSNAPQSLGEYDFVLSQSENTNLPPAINAFEWYKLMQQNEYETNVGDVNAILGTKAHLNIKRNWMGDPCAPKKFSWVGLECSYEDSAHNIITFGLVGEIPASLADLKNMETLDLSGNQLTGTVPNFLSELTSLKILDLSGNQFCGSVPPNLLARNRSGNIIFRYANNSGLCINGGSSSKKKNRTVKIVLLVIFSGLFTLAFLLVALFFTLRKKKQDGKHRILNDNVEIAVLSKKINFTYAKLGIITKNFQLVIGKGGFGTVYHGCLENGTQVAVKLLSQSSSQGAKEYMNEVQILTTINHKNLVSLVGYCCDGDRMALVYEYMQKGNLLGHLKGKHGVLSWKRRLYIAAETAEGLEYLHYKCTPEVIHRDLKTTNILLNDKMEAKVADFGLSKLLPQERSHVTTRVAGTRGYLDPVYHNTFQLTKKSDVYSFGVILLELITGQSAIVSVPEPQHVRDYVEERLPDISGLVDQNLKMNYDEASVMKMVDVAMRCTSADSNQRPTMATIVKELREAAGVEVDWASNAFETPAASLISLSISSNNSETDHTVVYTTSSNRTRDGSM